MTEDKYSEAVRLLQVTLEWLSDPASDPADNCGRKNRPASDNDCRCPVPEMTAFLETVTGSGAELPPVLAEVERLTALCVAAADEIEEHIDAHRDGDGYGPESLLNGLRGRTTPHYGDSGLRRFAQLATERAVRAEAALEKARRVAT